MERENREIIEGDGAWFVGWSLDVPGANGQGRTIEECRESIAAAIKLILEEKQ
jgi:predicted RNase H-like HicB family nuclease